jgi:large subunit ribosomal protein L20
MARVRTGVSSRRRRTRRAQQAEGFRAGRKNLSRQMVPTIMHSLVYARRDRRARKGDFRQLWIVRLNAACRLRGITYSTLMHGLRDAEILLDRKHLADLAVNDAAAFQQLIDLATASKN